MNRRFLHLALIVLVPVVVLAVFAWRGVESQRRAAWQDRRDEAMRLGTSSAKLLEQKLRSNATPLRFFPDPPVPQESDAGSRRLEAAVEPVALRQLRDDPQAGLTQAGLPARVLAAARLLEKERSQENEAALVKLAVEIEPSIMSPVLLKAAEKLGLPLPSWRAEWARMEQAQQVALRHPDVRRGWVSESDGPWWIDRESGNTVPFRLLSDLVGSEVVGIGQRPRVVGVLEYADEPLAQVAVSGFPGLFIQVFAMDSAEMETRFHSQKRWALGMVAGALGIAIAGLVLIYRTLERERRLNELKSQFVASVSHELRAPVGSIRLMADALDEGKVSPETAADFHRLISREGKRLSNLIENVLDFARIEQGRKRWHFEETDLPALVNDTIKLMEPLAGEKGISIERVDQPYDAEPVLDSSAIQQALVNLLDNAIKFSPAGSRVGVSLGNGGLRWTLAVRDEGPGIPPEEQEKIFERFYRPGDEMRRETQGTGIGLSLVKAIAEAHGGKVELGSRVGEGSTFTLVVPFDAGTKGITR